MLHSTNHTATESVLTSESSDVVIKAKRVFSEKQRKALKAGREKRWKRMFEAVENQTEQTKVNEASTYKDPLLEGNSSKLDESLLMDKPAPVSSFTNPYYSRNKNNPPVLQYMQRTVMNISKKRFHNEINVQLKQKESKFAIKTGKDDISLPAVIVFSGSSGSGKTYS